MAGCKTPVLPELESEALCLPHFISAVEQACMEMRKETITGGNKERRAEIARYIAMHGELLARAATSGLRMPDELKARVLNAFLTLMNLRENMDRAAERARSTISS
jgi:hypothetical protein